LIDSPGHFDFSGEVSTAVRISDGGLVLIDVLEGVCTQTVAVLKQAWAERLRPCLVLNKIDRLFTERGMTALEAYDHMKKVLEQANVVTAAFFRDELLRIQEKKLAKEAVASENSDRDVTTEMEGEDEEIKLDSYFEPTKGNVVFSCAVDGWGFRTSQFALLYSQRLGISQKLLEKTLWGEYYFNPKTKRVHTKSSQDSTSKQRLVPMFVQFILKNIWDVYTAVTIERDSAKTQKIVSSLKLSIPPRELGSSVDPKQIVQSIFSRWLPLSTAILEMTVEHMPNPIEAQELRIATIYRPLATEKASDVWREHEKIVSHLKRCDSSDEAPTIVFVAKVFAVDADSVVAATTSERQALTQQQRLALSNKEREANKFVGLARVFSGTLKKGQSIYVLGPKYDPSRRDEDSEEHNIEDTISKWSVQADELYLLMGRALEPIDEVPAGNVFGISGKMLAIQSTHDAGDDEPKSEAMIMRTATLSTSPFSTTFNHMPSNVSLMGCLKMTC